MYTLMRLVVTPKLYCPISFFILTDIEQNNSGGTLSFFRAKDLIGLSSPDFKTYFTPFFHTNFNIFGGCLRNVNTHERQAALRQNVPDEGGIA